MKFNGVLKKLSHSYCACFVCNGGIKVFAVTHIYQNQKSFAKFFEIRSLQIAALAKTVRRELASLADFFRRRAHVCAVRREIPPLFVCLKCLYNVFSFEIQTSFSKEKSQLAGGINNAACKDGRGENLTYRTGA